MEYKSLKFRVSALLTGLYMTNILWFVWVINFKMFYPSSVQNIHLLILLVKIWRPLDLLKVNNRIIRKMCEICSKLIIKTKWLRHWCRSGVFIVNFELISRIFLVFPLLILRKHMPARLEVCITFLLISK